MNLKYLLTVQTVARLASFQLAAVQLNYAQSTITFQVHQVERELDATLFVRNGRKVQLTAAGRAALPLIERLLQDSEALTAAAHPAALSGPLVIGVPETLLTYKLQPVLRAFKQRAPQVTLSLRVLNCYDLYAQMVAGTLDVALHYNVRDYPAGYQVTTLAHYPISVVAAPELAPTIDLITPHQKQPLGQIENDRRAQYQEFFTAYLAANGIHLAPAMELWSLETVKQSVASGLGLAVLPTFCVANELANGVLSAVPTKMPTKTLTAMMAVRRPTPAATLFVQLVKQHLQAEA